MNDASHTSTIAVRPRRATRGQTPSAASSCPRCRAAALDSIQARIVAAADTERRRLERDLHDGAQQRLVSLSLQLALVSRQLTPDSESKRMLDAARAELAASLTELRELARGLHPAVLSSRGLPAALESLACRAPLPVQLTVDVERHLPAPVEIAAYYLVSEALTNVAKYASATAAAVNVTRHSGRVVVEVIDDGIGGADAASGSGLRGLADRVQALRGHVHVVSPPGGGTRVRAEIPCGSLADRS
jgi:signal transduction histidine kinase